jgi:hypothetical protein
MTYVVENFDRKSRLCRVCCMDYSSLTPHWINPVCFRHLPLCRTVVSKTEGIKQVSHDVLLEILSQR